MPQDAVWFNLRVVNKQFVGIIKDVKFDTAENMYSVAVSLVDTTDPNFDLYVEKELVDLGKAVSLCTRWSGS